MIQRCEFTPADDTETAGILFVNIRSLRLIVIILCDRRNSLSPFLFAQTARHGTVSFHGCHHAQTARIRTLDSFPLNTGGVRIRACGVQLGRVQRPHLTPDAFPCMVPNLIIKLGARGNVINNVSILPTPALTSGTPPCEFKVSSMVSLFVGSQISRAEYHRTRVRLYVNWLQASISDVTGRRDTERHPHPSSTERANVLQPVGSKEIAHLVKLDARDVCFKFGHSTLNRADLCHNRTRLSSAANECPRARENGRW
jgi:hypothetical protein